MFIVFHLGLPTGYSLVSSLALAALTVAGMQVFREQIAMEGNLWRLAIGGFTGSWLFIFLLTVRPVTYYSTILVLNLVILGCG